jgi:hypothetical protein
MAIGVVKALENGGFGVFRVSFANGRGSATSPELDMEDTCEPFPVSDSASANSAA